MRLRVWHDQRTSGQQKRGQGPAVSHGENTEEDSGPQNKGDPTETVPCSQSRAISAAGGRGAENVMFHDFLLEHLRKVRFNYRGLYSGK